MGKMKKKFESGAATAYIARNQAVKKLQLTIADFRRLCILKGVYPVEPKHKKKVNKGTTANRTFYYAKDINYLAHEPIINKFRDFKIYVRRLKKAKGRRERKVVGHLKTNKPYYKIDHIVKERYPSFNDAVKDLDDCLSLLFLFSILPKSRRVYVERVHLSRRLTLEFLHYVIASKSLRKCFISIKGYYFQADVMGQKITWIMPHKLAYQTPDDVDFRIMSTFVEFYSTMLGFVNYKLYQDVGLIYPPKLAISDEVKESAVKTENDDYNDDFLASLNCDFIKLADDLNKVNDTAVDEFPLTEEENPDALDKAKIEEENLKKLKNLFKGLKFFLNREIPREQFSFVIRAFGGGVSWDKTVAVGSTYQETDETITHHVIDRPLVGKTYLNRTYIQPQWIFDCVNENLLLPVIDYIPGNPLPPHLSPFVEANEGDYIPPEKQRIIKMKLGIVDEKIEEEETNGKDEEAVKIKVAVKAKSDDEEEEEEEEREDFGNDLKVDLESESEEIPKEQKTDDEEEEPKSKKSKKQKKIEQPKKVEMSVSKGKLETENIMMKLKKATDEEKKLSEMMIPKKHKRLYGKIMHGKKKQRQEVEKLKEKRKIHDNKVKNEKKKKIK